METPRSLRATVTAVAILLLLLVAAVVVSLRMWSGTGEVEMGWGGLGALVLGSIGTLALGGGLMALVFYSARSGHDERAHQELQKRMDESPPDPE